MITMNLVQMSGFQRLLPVPATSLVLLMLLALGTFLAGINLLSVQICFLGLAMALAVPAIAWLKQSALFLLFGRGASHRAWHHLLACSQERELHRVSACEHDTPGSPTRI